MSPHAKQLSLAPPRRTGGGPIGTRWSPSGTSSATSRYTFLCSRNSTGSGSRMADLSRPLASAGVLGTTTLKAGTGGEDAPPQAGNVGVERLHRLRVIEASMHAAAEWCSDHDGYGPVAVGAVARPCGLADDLVEGWVDEVRELDLRDGYEPVERGADRHADDP